MSDAPRLLDADGKPIPREVIASLRQEIAPTGAQYARPPFSGHLAFGINPQRLAGIIRASDTGNSLDWMILAEEIEELYPHYQAVLSKRRRQVAQLPITVEDANDEVVPDAEKHGDLVREWLKTGALQHAMFDVLDGVPKGYSVHEIIWEQADGHAWPLELKYRPQRFFEISWLDGETVWLRTETGFQDLLPHKFLVHAHRSKSGHVIRGGLTRAVAFLWMYASFTLKDWALFVQAYGPPYTVGRYGPEASDSDKTTLWRAVSSIAGDVHAMIPKSMEIELVTMPDRAAGSALYEKRLDWLDRSVSKLVLGGTAGTDAISGGHAVGREHREVEQDVERFDAGLLSNTINRQIVPAMVAFTFGPQKAYPVVTVGRPDEVPIRDVVDALADLGGMGLTAKASQIRARLQLDEPDDDDKIVGGVTPAPVPKPTIPAPARELPRDGFSQRPWLSGLITLQSEAPPEVVEQLTQRLAEEAAGAMHGMTQRVRAEFDAATDIRDLAHRLHGLKLDPSDFAEAMARGLALANLVGQASLVEELRHRQHVARMSEDRADLPDTDFAVPELRELRIDDETHVRLAWDMVDRTQGLTPAQRQQARRLILRRARRLGIDTSGWDSHEN